MGAFVILTIKQGSSPTTLGKLAASTKAGI